MSDASDALGASASALTSDEPAAAGAAAGSGSAAAQTTDNEVRGVECVVVFKSSFLCVTVPTCVCQERLVNVLGAHQGSDGELCGRNTQIMEVRAHPISPTTCATF
jgi:hypothetical protein